MGSGHFIRRNGPGLVERNLRAAGANPYLVVFGTNAVGGFDDLDKRFDAWQAPTIVSLSGSWVGDLPAMPVINGGTAPATPLKLADAADAMLYVGPRDSLTELRMPRSELDGTPYGNELNRRLMIFPGHPINFLYDQTEVPQFTRPQPHPQSGLQANSSPVQQEARHAASAQEHERSATAASAVPVTISNFYKLGDCDISAHSPAPPAATPAA